ncbi:hypothetical protein BDZ97DRAFT_1192322 [Flammula alnicola]|nr:hypothetical protein BDZ97DRAFT_1192322 [Flammula alnicola]
MPIDKGSRRRRRRTPCTPSPFRARCQTRLLGRGCIIMHCLQRRCLLLLLPLLPMWGLRMRMGFRILLLEMAMVRVRVVLLGKVEVDPSRAGLYTRRPILDRYRSRHLGASRRLLLGPGRGAGMGAGATRAWILTLASKAWTRRLIFCRHLVLIMAVLARRRISRVS